MPTEELFVKHEAGHTTTDSRFYFKETLNKRVLNRVIRPNIISRVAKKSPSEYEPYRVEISTIDGYSNYLVVRWLRTDVLLKYTTQSELEEAVKDAVDAVLTDAFGWNASVIRVLTNSGSVRKKADELKVNWDKGQLLI